MIHLRDYLNRDEREYRTSPDSSEGARRNGSGSWVLSRVPLVGEDSRLEERANAATHALALVWSFAACIMLILVGVRLGTPFSTGAFLLYGVSLVNLYAISTIYHYVTLTHFKQLFRLLDHVSIFILIAGTYTPILMLYFDGELRWILLAVEWGLALLGTAYKVFFLGKLRVLSVLLYVAMGWLAVALWHQQAIPQAAGLSPWLIAGGVCYTAGLFFFAMKRLAFHHALWHVWVIAGSVLHFIGIYRTALLVSAG